MRSWDENFQFLFQELYQAAYFGISTTKKGEDVWRGNKKTGSGKIKICLATCQLHMPMFTCVMNRMRSRCSVPIWNSCSCYFLLRSCQAGQPLSQVHTCEGDICISIRNVNSKGEHSEITWLNCKCECE